MKWLKRLERKLGRFAVPNVTVGIIAGQVLVYLTQLPAMMQQQGGPPRVAQLLDNMQLLPELVLEGEVWRLLTFIFVPPLINPFFAFLFWYMFYFMGTTLEANWGTFRYNLFLGIGYLATVAAAFLVPGAPATSAFLLGSIFLAFAYLFPDFVIYILFILPVKIKWLALVTWIGYAWMMIVGDWSIRVVVLAAVANFLAFFGIDILRRMRSAHRRHKLQFQARAGKNKINHECRVCGLTSDMAPKGSFRYCSQCAGQQCYCKDHIRNHEHVVEKSRQKGVGMDN